MHHIFTEVAVTDPPHDPDRLAASYLRFSDQPVANPQVFVDEGCILDLDAEGRLVGVEIIGPRILTDVLPAIFARARFRQATTKADLADEHRREVDRPMKPDKQ